MHPNLIKIIKVCFTLILKDDIEFKISKEKRENKIKKKENIIKKKGNIIKKKENIIKKRDC